MTIFSKENSMPSYKFVIEITSEQTLTEHQLATVQQTYAARVQGFHSDGKDLDVPVKVLYYYDREHSDAYVPHYVTEAAEDETE
jgi:hypothetical protein